MPETTPQYEGSAYGFYKCRRCGLGYEDRDDLIEDVQEMLMQLIRGEPRCDSIQLHDCKDLVGGMGIADLVGVTWNEKRA